MILISACLAGINCKYSGGNNCCEQVRKLYEEGKAVAVCPEQLGGLPTPRACSEILGDRVVNTEGKDMTEQFVRGAEKALAICREHECTLAVLKAKSPSCGCNGIYDGTFSHTLVEGKGIFARMLETEGIRCMDEMQYTGETE